jgi:DNA-binding NarL/FixJ family response regulator
MSKRNNPVDHWSPPPIDPALWTALVDDSAVAVKITDADAVVLWANSHYADLVGADGADALRGKGPEDFVPAPFAQEIRIVTRAVALSGEAVMHRTLWKGRPVVSHIRRLHSGPAILVTIRPEAPGDLHRRKGRGLRFVQSAYNDEGKIGLLTARERSVLALIASGLSTAEIAKTLGRSTKTIENQRNSMGRKLKVVNRVELARIAIDAGLAPPPGQAPRRRARRGA